MKTIHRYDIAITDIQVLDLPVGARILSTVVESDHIEEALTFWAVVDTTAEKVPVAIHVVGTENPMEDRGLRYVGTAVTAGGRLVWHVFVEGV